MLPGAHGQPPPGSELLVGVRVASPVAGDLLWPVPGVLANLTATVVRAAVPEAAIEEHSDLLGREHEIRRSTQVRERTSMNEVAESSSVYGSADGQLRGSVLPALTLHAEPSS